MSNNLDDSCKRRIDLRREELTRSTERFLARGGQIVELPTGHSAPPAIPAKYSLVISREKSVAQRREELELKIVAMRRTGVSAREIARLLGVGRSTVMRNLKARGLS